MPKCMMTSSNGNIFRITGPLCGEFTGEFPTQRPVTRNFDIFFDLRLNKHLSKQPWGWWFETPSWSLWRRCNGFYKSAAVSVSGASKLTHLPLVPHICVVELVYHWFRSWLVVCSVAKPLSKPVMTYHQLHHKTSITKFLKLTNLHCRNLTWNHRL